MKYFGRELSMYLCQKVGRLKISVLNFEARALKVVLRRRFRFFLHVFLLSEFNILIGKIYSALLIL